MNVREWALPVYTILMQLAAGALLTLWLTRALMRKAFKNPQAEHLIRNPILVIVLTIIAAMFGSHFHLSKPWLSFLAVSNFRSSWLSREIIFTVLFFLAVSCLWLTIYYSAHQRIFQSVLGWSAVGFGLAVVYCMGRIYMLPTQVAWNSSMVLVSFYVTTLLLGVMAIVCLLILDLKYAQTQKSEDVHFRKLIIQRTFPGFLIAAVVLAILNIVIIFLQINQLQGGDLATQTSLDLLFELYFPLLILRLILLVSAPALLGFYTFRVIRGFLSPGAIMTPVFISCLLTLVAEIIGRFLFYATHVRVGI